MVPRLSSLLIFFAQFPHRRQKSIARLSNRFLSESAEFCLADGIVIGFGFNIDSTDVLGMWLTL